MHCPVSFQKNVKSSCENQHNLFISNSQHWSVTAR